MPSHSTLHPRPGVGSLGAHVGPLSSPSDAAARGADRAGHLRARRYSVGLRSPSASTALPSRTPPLLWSTSRPNSHPEPNPNQVPANPGLWAGDAAREAAAGRAWRRATGDLPPGRESLPRRRLGAAPRAVATPRVAPGPAHAGSRFAPAHRGYTEVPLKPPTSAWPRSFRLPRNGSAQGCFDAPKGMATVGGFF